MNQNSDFCHLYDAIGERIKEKRSNVPAQHKENLKSVLTENLHEDCLMLSSSTSVQDHFKKIQYHILQLFFFVPKHALFPLTYTAILLLQGIYSLCSNNKICCIPLRTQVFFLN